MTYQEFEKELTDLLSKFFGGATFMFKFPFRLQVLLPNTPSFGGDKIGVQISVGLTKDLGDIANHDG
jgi:hypothetical protein